MQKKGSEGNLLSLKSLEDLEHAIESTDDIDSEKTWDNLITLETFNDWISVASYKIECLDLAIKIYRWRLQTCILLGLLLSTASGTISVTQFGNYSSNLKFGLNLVLTITSFAVALLTGIVKTFKLQENLEEYISLKQSWVSFSAKISNGHLIFPTFPMELSDAAGHRASDSAEIRLTTLENPSRFRTTKIATASSDQTK